MAIASISDHPCLHDDSALAQSLRPYGLYVLGVMDASDEAEVPDLADGRRPRSLIMIGNAGPEFWQNFQKDRREEPHPLDAWTRRLLTPIAEAQGMTAVFPFEGPPFYPFNAWGHKAGAFFQSTFVPSIHPTFGMWFGLRAAFLSPEVYDLPWEVSAFQPPCYGCEDQPCLTACPALALEREHYDVETCIRYITSEDSFPCATVGCRARHACPVGQDYIYTPEQATFHMNGFIPILDTFLNREG